jgi:hypothetical protein
MSSEKYNIVSLIAVIVVVAVVVIVAVKMRGDEVDSVIKGKLTVNGDSRLSTMGANTVSIDKNGSILLGNKFRLNGGKDAWMDDDWLRIMNKDNTAYGGGIAALKLYSSGDTIVEGNASVAGRLTANSVWIRKNNYLYYPEDAVYQNHNIFDMLDGRIISKSGNPGGWDDGSYKTTKWPDENGNNILRIGSRNTTDGLRVEVPAGKNVIWLRCLNDRWISVQVYKIDGNIDLGNFCSGFRKLHKYAPDGGQHDARWDFLTWFPIPVPGPGSYKIVSGNRLNDGGSDAWIGGIAFSTNPWNHAFNSAVGIHWNVNGGENVTWNSDNWNNDMLAQITNDRMVTMVIPIVPSGRDKLLYLMEHNNQWDGAMHRGITVDGTPIERLRSTWDHPLARSINSKMYNRFLAAFVPESLTRNKRFITVKIDMTRNAGGNHIFFREAGTIDAY